ncbi:acyl carrier protein [compost metagenome]
MRSTERWISEQLVELLECQREIGIDEELQNLGFNSFNFIKLVMRIEEKFDIEFDEEEDLYVELFGTIRLSANFINSKLQGG